MRFDRTPDAPTEISLVVDGERIPAVAGETVASALIAAGRTSFGGNPRTGRPAAPWCLMGVCFGCLCTVDGVPGVQACLAPARDGTVVRTGGGGDAG